MINTSEMLESTKQSLRASFSPMQLVLSNKMRKIRNNLYILDANQFLMNKFSILEYCVALILIYKGKYIKNLFERLDRLTIYLELIDDELYGGIYNTCTQHKLTKVLFASSSQNRKAISDSQYIYNMQSKFIEYLRG